MAYSILTEARVKPSVADLQPTERSYAVYWSDNADLQGWTTISDLDIVGAWDGFLFGTKRTSDTGSIGPTNTFPPVDAAVNDRMFFRMKYDKHPKNQNAANLGKIQWTTTADPVFNDTKSITFEVFPDGKWHFYEIDVGQAYEWVGLINNVRFFPCTNGYINDEFFLNFFEIGTTDFTFDFDNPNAGLPGKVVGAKILSQAITIEQGVNDTLLVNIDGYGNVQIVLTPQTAVPAIIARDISLQLGKVAIGGYLRAEAYIDSTTQKLNIESGTRAADSTVSIGGGTAGFVLGLLDEVGTFLGTSTQGSAAASGYTPLSPYRLTTLEIMALFDNDNDLPAFSLEPQSYVVQAGRADYGTTNQELQTSFIQEGRYTDNTRAKTEVIGTVDGEGKTYVDLNHPFTDEGKLELVAFNGSADVSGGTKWKVFRPKLDGDLELVDEGIIGKTNITEDPDGGLVITDVPGAYSVDVSSSNVWVRRGDLLGVYNASFHLYGSNAQKANAMYYEFDGDATGTVTPLEPAGAGELGLPVYARGAATKSRAVVDIDLGRRLNLDRLIVTGEEDTRDLEYNVATAASAQFSVDVPGSHTVCYTYNFILNLRTCFSRSNQGFNVQALNDGVTLAENGITTFGDGGVGGEAGADVDGATYFYANGDAEFMGIYEFSGQANGEAYNFARDTVGIDCYFSSSTPRLDKPIGKAVIYFKDKKNQRAWQIETARGSGSKGGNGSKPGFQLVPELTSVKIDDKEIKQVGLRLSTKDPESNQNILLNNPVIMDVIAKDGTRNPQKGVDYVNHVGELGGVNVADQITYAKFQWNRFEWNFDAIRCTGFRWYCDYHWSTKISEFQVFAVSDNAESLGDNTQPLFSADGEVFATGALESATTTRAVYKLGGSPQYLRLIFRPTLKLDIHDVEVVFEEDQICLGKEGRLTTGAMPVDDARIGQVGESTPLEITNTMGETADLILDIPSDINTARQLLYSNQLKSEEDILYPEVGPPGRVDFKADKVIKEARNVANNARCFGLRNVASGTVGQYLSDNLIENPGFETGDLTGWTLTVLQSGTAVDGAGVHYQVPRVMDINTEGPDLNSASNIQTGSYVFGFSFEDAKASNQLDTTEFSLLGSTARDGPYVPVEFEISQVIDVSAYADQIDAGGVILDVAMRYFMYFDNSEDPTLYIYGAPTASGVATSSGVYIDGYGSNLLRSTRLGTSTPVYGQSWASALLEPTFSVAMKTGTRFVKLHLYVDAETYREHWGKRQKVLLEDFSAQLSVPAVTEVKWYKGWRNGTGSADEFEGFTDSRFEPVLVFTKTVGSTHWYQPWDRTATSTSPQSYQSLGFSTVFEFDRLAGIQSYRRMTASDHGFLGAQWDGEREIAGLKIGLWHRTPGSAANAGNHPNHFHLEVLKTPAELGGTSPDIENPAHFKVMRTYRSFGSQTGPTYVEALGSGDEFTRVPSTRLMTLLFESGPVTTEGMKIVFTNNCDRFEYVAYPDTATYRSVTTCPAPPESWRWGLSATAFTPLESLDISTLPLDNTGEGNESGNVYAAVDLRRRYDISTDSDLFELIARTPTNANWTTGSVAYSADETDDPNQVSWTGGSDECRWIRFATGSTNENEFIDDVVDYGAVGTYVGPHVSRLPQAILDQARIYPNIQTTSIHTVGYNSTWDDLGYILTDRRSDTFIYYSDYPVVALDLGKKYLISSTDVDVTRQRHELIAGVPGLSNVCDYDYWDADDEDNFAYSLSSGGSLSRPETVPFRAFGAGVPDYATRWIVVKGQYPLLCRTQEANEPKEYNFKTVGQTLFEVAARPRSPEVVTNNASWFTTKRAVLQDISTFNFELGTPYDVTNGVDYGSYAGTRVEGSDAAANDLGDPYNAFDGVFDESLGEIDVWGVSVRDPETNLDDADKAFPHAIWRVFRDPYSGENLTKDVKAIFLRGFDEKYYPTDFRFQYLLENSDGSNKDPNLSTSWDNIEDALFADIDTYQVGLGFFYVLAEAVSTKGIRVYISDSEYPDDSVVTETPDADDGIQPNSTVADVSGPQTRVSEVVIYDQTYEEATIEGEIVTNHALGATVTSTTAVPDQGPEKAVDGDLSTFWQATGFQDTLTITLPRASTISRFEWEKDQRLDQLTGGVGQNAPQDFTLSVIVGTDTRTLLNVEGHLGATYSGTLSEPVTSDTFIFDVTRVQGQQTDASSIQVSEVRLQEIFTQTTPLATVESTPDRRPGSTNQTSTKVVYAADADAVAKVYAAGIDCGSDVYFSERDFFSLWVRINDVSLLDTDFGSIKFGNSSDVYYAWDLSGMGLQSGWNELRLQFSDADYNTPIAFQPGAQYSPDYGLSQVDFITEDVDASSSVDGQYARWIIEAPGIRYFELEFRGVRGSQDLEMTIDDFRIVRNTFEDTCRFGPSLYLNNSETFVINIEGLDLSIGTVEFWIQPDWDTGGRIRTDTSIIPALFRVMRPDGSFLSFFYRPDQGFIGMVYDRTQLYQFITSVSEYRFDRRETFHVAVVWDHRARIEPTNASFIIYINGAPIFGTDQRWYALREPGASVVFGGEVGQNFATAPFNATALTFSPVPGLASKHTASSWALIENLKMYNYAKTNFSDINNASLVRTQLINPSELLEISTDNVTFAGAGSDLLPLVVKAVPDNTSTTVYLRTNIPKGLTGDESRDASLMIRWKTPLRSCD